MMAAANQRISEKHAKTGKRVRYPAALGKPSARDASAAVQMDAPNKTKSLIKNCPAFPSTGKPWLKCMAPGVENKKLSVNRNVAMAPRLPKNDALGNIGRNASRMATVISMVPIKFEAACTLSQWYIQDISGLFAINGRMPAASAEVNFKTPISSNTTTSP